MSPRAAGVRYGPVSPWGLYRPPAAAPVVRLAAGLVTGLAVEALAGGAALLLAAPLLLAAAWRDEVRVALLAVVLGLGLGHFAGDARRPAPRLLTGLALPAVHELEGEIVTLGLPNPRGLRAVVAVTHLNGRPTSGLVIRLGSDAGRPDPLGRGDGIRVTTRLSRLPPARNPGAFDVRAQAARAGIHLQAWVDDPTTIEVRRRGRSVPALLHRVRRAVAARLESVHAPAEAGLARALVLGDRTTLDLADRARFRSTGQGHLVAVSGLHVGIVLAGWLLILRGLGLGIRAIWAGGLVSVACYVPFAGGAPSTLRAGAGAALYLAGRLLGRCPTAFGVLATVVVTVLGVDPARIRDAAFTFSVAAVTGILVLFGSLQDLLVPGRPAIPGLIDPPRARVRKAFALSLSAWLGTAPLLCAYLGRLCLVAAPVSVLSVPLTGLLIGAAFVSLLPVPGLDVLGALAFEGIANVLRGFLDLVIAAGLGAREASIPGAGWFVAYVVGIAALALGRRRLRVAGICALASLLGWTVLPRAPPRPHYPRVVLLDVGHGQAAILLLPDGRAALLDAGRVGDPAVGRRIVVPALRALGVRRLALATATHADSDHTSGLGDVHAAVPFCVLVIPRTMRPRARARLAAIGAPLVESERPALLLDGPWGRLATAAPSRGDPPGRSRNDRGLVLRLTTTAGRSMVFPGDRETTGIDAWLGRETAPHADVLLLPHHGRPGAGRTHALAVVRPEIRLASCGRSVGPDLPEDTVATSRRGAIVVDLRPEGARITTPWDDAAREQAGADGYHGPPPMLAALPAPLSWSTAWVAAALLLLAVATVKPFRWLTPAGAGGAWALGLAAWLAFGPQGLAALFAPFVVASLLGRLPGGPVSEARTLRQVGANGLPALLGCALALWAGLPEAGAAVFVGGLACLGADTSATEIGTRYGGTPRSVVSGRPVAPGTNGGVTGLGLCASLGGAALAPLSFLAWGGFTWPALGVFLAAGVAGGLLDSVLGATLEPRLLDNDGVNLVSGLAAAAASLAALA